MTHYLRFPDATTGLAALDAAGLLTDDDAPITASHTHALDVIGLIADLPGWHVNYMGELPDEWQQYLVTPQQPVRVWM